MDDEPLAHDSWHSEDAVENELESYENSDSYASDLEVEEQSEDWHDVEIGRLQSQMRV